MPPMVQAIDEWRATGQLPQARRNDLRNIVHGAITARLMLEDGFGGSPLWVDAKKEMGDSGFDPQIAIKIGDQKVAEPVVTIDAEDTKAVRALRAIAWVAATGDWNSVENGQELQVLVEEQVSAWTHDVSNTLLPDRDNHEDAELVVAAHALLAMSKALGIPDAFKSDGLSRSRALFAPEVDANRPRQKLRQWQERTCYSSQRLSRKQLQFRVLRLASFAQGTGSPVALDLPRLIRALRGKESVWDLPAASGRLGEIVVWIQTLQSMLPGLRDEAIDMVPDLSELGGTLLEAIKQLDTLVVERATNGQLPAVINQVQLSAAGKAIKQGDQNRIESVRSKLDAWDSLSADDQLRLLTDDWDDAANRVRNWHATATVAVQALEAKLGTGANSAAQLEYEQTRTALLTTLQTVADLLEPAGSTEKETV